MIDYDEEEELKKLKCPICNHNNNECEDLFLEDEDGCPAYIYSLQCINCKYGIYYDALIEDIEDIINKWDKGKNEL